MVVTKAGEALMKVKLLEHLCEELVQVAAVAVCWLEALGWTQDNAMREIREERFRQDMKWGSQRGHGHRTWLAILTEEVGEVARELLDSHLDEGA